MVDKENEIKDKDKLRVYSIIKVLIFIVILFLSVFFAYSLIKTNMVPNKYICLLVVVLIVINVLMGLFLKSRRLWLNAIGILFVTLIGFVFAIGSRYVNRTMNVLGDIITVKEEKTSYYVLTNEGIYSDVAELNGKIIGLLTNEKDALIAELSKTYNFEYKDYETIGEIIYALKLKEVDAIVISSSLYEYLKSENAEFLELITTIGEFEIVGKATEVVSEINIGDSFTFFISGLDTRDTSYLSPYGCSDVNILVVVNPKTHKVLMVHVPRDYYVYLYNRPRMKDKLTHAGWYGIETSMKTVGNIFDLDVNTYLKVNFKALTTLVDAIDGIDVYSDITFNSSHMNGWVVQKGVNHMDGAKALAFSRERYAYTTGDIHRGQNQEAVIQAIIKKVSNNTKYLAKYDQILSDASPYFSTNFEMTDIQKLIKDQIDAGSMWNVESYNLTGTGAMDYAATYPDVQAYVMIPNQNSIDTAKSKIIAVMSGK